MGKGQISRIMDCRSVCFLVLFYFLFSAANSDAHPGRKDSQGGHHQRATGTYHFHDGPLVGQTFASKAACSALSDVGTIGSPTGKEKAPS